MDQDHHVNIECLKHISHQSLNIMQKKRVVTFDTPSFYIQFLRLKS